MFNINGKAKVTGIYVSSYLNSAKSDILNPQEVYSITILPDEGLVDMELNHVFECEAGFHSRLDKPDWINRKGYLTFTSIVKPHLTLKDELHEGDSVCVSFKPTINYTPDRENAYGQLQLIGVDQVHDPNDDIDCSTVENAIDI